MAVTAVVGAVVTIAGVVNSIDDAKKRRDLQANLSLLNEKQQMDLAKEMAKTQNTNERIKMLTDAIQAARNAQAERDRKTQVVQWVLVGVVAVVTLGIVAWYLKPANK